MRSGLVFIRPPSTRLRGLQRESRSGVTIPPAKCYRGEDSRFSLWTGDGLPVSAWHVRRLDDPRLFVRSGWPCRWPGSPSLAWLLPGFPGLAVPAAVDLVAVSMICACPLGRLAGFVAGGRWRSCGRPSTTRRAASPFNGFTLSRFALVAGIEDGNGYPA